jgi:proteasome-associated ATPase
MYATDDDNKFLEVTYAKGEREIFYFKDFASGAMIEHIVARAKKKAVKRAIDHGERGIMLVDLLEAVREEFKENDSRTPRTRTTGRASRARRASGSSTSAR